ncbi:hypothetical protein K378_04575 [Streptomyces sp. Amel2xB2]|uniref:AMIN-like domain-containing (lipo)protein n=1 Tax=Streptomyces sp. Amel2xB2 TaxID=1305829 RepID=UPI000DC01863|nr:hypothetical protein [Streptomyces sp. Amel2xB2]RAJ59878.1 hypothetical protein K378_04575 [Streptomyces sp. Amel2xB2]
MRRTRLLVTAALTSAGLLTALSAGTAAAAGPAAAAPERSAAAAADCGVTWGSRPKSGTGTGDRPLTDVRTGRHDCYDRMVLDIRPGTPAGSASYRVRYVDRLYQDGSGRPLPVGGGAVLEIVASAPSHDPETFEPTYPGHAGEPLPGVQLKGYRTFRDARFGAGYEGTTQLGLGVRARLPFRVLDLGDRLVVDVAHTWTALR